MSPASSIVKQPVLAALKRFTTCGIGDALVRLNVRHGGYLSGLKMFSPTEGAGTSKIIANDKVSPWPSKHFADAIPPHSVVFVSQPKGYISACWGGLMSTRAQEAGAAGIHRELASFSQEGAEGETVKINLGDIIMGDADGVVAIPPHLAEECVKLCVSRWNIDEATRQCITDGEDIGPNINRLRQ
ncbi:hypothetical protein BU25DRAFT_435044 [Macroventuria anomochaeta]|uniref:Uncharacterized protein n=1 Tax=Macroventuria anomochaeta TaxID=301207 RepID=A0ACB6RLV6_9PLEO|nr:uncharacterized protein BU25DRAFT_435044 [Macroventuria anomochaeta]KAF2622139.1 hypothetical protein BU25DRAFT_435044 [Macroventuria anomochaeta]